MTFFTSSFSSYLMSFCGDLFQLHAAADSDMLTLWCLFVDVPGRQIAYLFMDLYKRKPE